ncbi:MAG: M20/M25/M40 family metallo-hydrolase [Chitinophagaceae bacterium]|nr:MAG: M20/M25/M40 family metallo-hydrolase [Chitinophagaceae bacterium]
MQSGRAYEIGSFTKRLVFAGVSFQGNVHLRSPAPLRGKRPNRKNKLFFIEKLERKSARPRLLSEGNEYFCPDPKNFPSMRRYLLPFALLLQLSASAQKVNKADAALQAALRTHVEFLSSDVLEGRRTGSEGERLAADYIVQQFQKAGLSPKGSDGFLQPFEVDEGLSVEGTQLQVDGKTLELNTDYFPLAWSGNSKLEGNTSTALMESGTPWFLDLKDELERNSGNPHWDINEALRRQVKTMAAKGATAVVFYNSGTADDKIAFEGRDRSERAAVPVFYITKSAYKKFFADETATHNITMVSQVRPRVRTGNNVAAFLDNGAAQTIILGAHYDHLGHGEDRNSMYRGTDRLIHRGADDNASGTAALIELARLLKASKYKGHNYLFLAFSGEELGLYGSKHFVEHPTVDLASVSYMINMDMVGRLNDSSKALTVGGYGTTPLWGQLYAVSGKKGLYQDGLSFRFDSSGVGPSDHTSFYRKDIPVLFYFTGVHSDYHRPSDAADKINYTGEVRILRHIESLLAKTDKSGKPAFTKTRDLQTGTANRFSVTLGIMPDYTYSGNGVRVDGVSEGRPAQKAGMKTGDVITALGEHKVSSVESYMGALGKFKKGEQTTVTYLREGREEKATIEF